MQIVSRQNNMYLIETKSPTVDILVECISDIALFEAMKIDKIILDILNSAALPIPDENETGIDNVKPSKDSDMLSFTPTGKSKEVTSKIGKVLRKMYPKMRDEHIAEIVARYKSAIGNIDIIEDDKVSKWYKSSCTIMRGNLANSCMIDKDFVDFYDKEPNVRIALYLDEKKNILGRALLWKIDGKWMMDRIYVTNDNDKEYFVKYAKKKGYGHTDDKQVDFLPEQKNLLKFNNNLPYLDSFPYIKYSTKLDVYYFSSYDRSEENMPVVGYGHQTHGVGFRIFEVNDIVKLFQSTLDKDRKLSYVTAYVLMDKEILVGFDYRSQSITFALNKSTNTISIYINKKRIIDKQKLRKQITIFDHNDITYLSFMTKMAIDKAMDTDDDRKIKIDIRL